LAQQFLQLVHSNDRQQLLPRYQGIPARLAVLINGNISTSAHCLLITWPLRYCWQHLLLMLLPVVNPIRTI
jgi:hypothetical protein